MDKKSLREITPGLRTINAGCGFMRKAALTLIFHVKYQPPASTRPSERACSWLTFRRGEGLILSKAYFTPRRNFGYNLL